MKVILKCSTTQNGKIVEPGEADLPTAEAKALIEKGKAVAVSKATADKSAEKAPDEK